MFGICIQALASAAEQAWREEDRFQTMLNKLSPEERKVAIAEREKQRLEETEERRHKEKCDAIRSTSFWRFGS